MCYHIQTPGKAELVSVFEDDYKIIAEYDGYYHNNGFAHNDVPAITSEKPDTIQLLQWGLIPAWVKDREKAAEMQNFTLNATCEGVFEKPSFKGSIGKNRCVIIVKGFFENRHEGKKKYPYFVHSVKSTFLFLGGLYSQWTDKATGEVLNTCSVITTPANSLMAKIHNSKLRMPLIIPEALLPDWLNTQASPLDITAMMKPANENTMSAYTISSLVNNSRSRNTNVEEVTEPLVYPELQLLD